MSFHFTQRLRDSVVQPNHALQRTAVVAFSRFHAFGSAVAELDSLGGLAPPPAVASANAAPSVSKGRFRGWWGEESFRQFRKHAAASVRVTGIEALGVWRGMTRTISRRSARMQSSPKRDVYRFHCES